MIVYNVTLNVEDEIHEEWIEWMKTKHIPDVMNTGYFLESKIMHLLTRQPGETGKTYSIQYICENMKDLEEYQEKCAPELQKEHSDKFEGKFVSFRTLMETV